MITDNDIKIFQSQDNTDNDSGGGSRTSVELVDGEVNNLFPDISRIDTTSGDVALRKIHPTVSTSNRDVYFGAHGMLRKTPSDPKVSAMLFFTNDPNDKRLAAQNKIESYVIASFLESFYLFGNHIEGAKAVTWLQPVSGVPPSVGEVYMLRDPDLTEQYIRVTSINTQDITLVFFIGGTPTNFIRRRIIAEIEQPLKKAFIGSAFNPSGQLSNTADTFATQIADAAKFYSTKTLAVDALFEATNITVDSIFEQIVPASKKQTPLVNRDALNQGTSIISSGAVKIFGVFDVRDLSLPLIVNIGEPVVANSLTRIQNTFIHDDGAGNIVNDLTSLIIGTIDYQTGSINVTGSMSPTGSGNDQVNATLTYELGIIINSNVQFTNGILITSENQGLVFVKNISPIPTSDLGGLLIDYRSQNKWQTILSNPDGTLGSDPSIGAGLINDNGDGTATVSVTLGALPDQDSTVIFSWASNERFTHHQTTNTIHDGLATISPSGTSMYAVISLGSINIDPASFNMVTVGGTVTAGADGVLIDTANDLKGFLDTMSGDVIIEKLDVLTRLNLPSDVITIDFDTFNTGQAGDIKNQVASKTPTGGQALLTENTVTGVITFNIGETVEVGSVRFSFAIPVSVLDPPNVLFGFQTLETRTVTFELATRSDGSVYMFGTNRVLVPGSGHVIGTVAANGDVSITLVQTLNTVPNPGYSGSFGTTPRYLPDTDFYHMGDVDISMQYRAVSQTGTTTAKPQVVGTVFSLISYKIRTQGGIAGEVEFTFPQNTSLDVHNLKSSGNLIFDETGLQVGTINKDLGEIDVIWVSSFDSMYLDFDVLFTDEIQVIEGGSGEFTEPVSNIVFRTSATKLTTSSFQLRYKTPSGSLSATTDQNGVITGIDIDSILSSVDTLTGMATIIFTKDVIPSSLKYDAVAETTLPLDPELLGLDPVRLPPDGRVPVFEAGRHLIIFNEVTTPVVGGTPIAGQVDTLARSDQAFVEVIDTNGKRLNTTAFVADKVLGTVTFATPLVLEDRFGNPLTAPFDIVDRVEDMTLAVDVQLNGNIGISSPLSRNYTNGITFVASTLVWGDTGARVFNLFEQEIWNLGAPVWSDVRIGDDTTAKYDEINFPLQITNADSTSERWAIIFKSPTSVDVVGESLGVIDTAINITTTDVAPINPATGLPYFIMLFGGFGSGWVTNNVIRFNTDSGDVNVWIIRTVQSGALSEETDGIEIEIRGDAN